jgi:hypothetical protein
MIMHLPISVLIELNFRKPNRLSETAKRITPYNIELKDYFDVISYLDKLTIASLAIMSP